MEIGSYQRGYEYIVRYDFGHSFCKGSLTLYHTSPTFNAKPHSSVGSVADLRPGGRWFPAIFFSRIDDSYCDRIHSSVTAVLCFDNGYVRKKPLAWKEYCAEDWLKEHQESIDCTGCPDITE